MKTTGQYPSVPLRVKITKGDIYLSICFARGLELNTSGMMMFGKDSRGCVYGIFEVGGCGAGVVVVSAAAMTRKKGAAAAEEGEVSHDL